MLSELLQIGSVCKPHGLRGELRVRLHDPASDALAGLKRLWLGSDEAAAAPGKRGLREWSIEKAKPLDDGYWLLFLAGVQDRNGAEGLRAQHLYARRDELPPLDEDEVYLSDLIGCRVVDLADREVGVAREVLDVAGNPLLVVERPGREDALIPLVPEILRSVELSSRVVQIDPPEGLLELDLRPSGSGDAARAALGEVEAN